MRLVEQETKRLKERLAAANGPERNTHGRSGPPHSHGR
jgi:hypothetical protein